MVAQFLVDLYMSSTYDDTSIVPLLKVSHILCLTSRMSIDLKHLWCFIQYSNTFSVFDNTLTPLVFFSIYCFFLPFKKENKTFIFEIQNCVSGVCCLV